MRGRVALPGQLPNAARYLKAFDVFTLPSLKEGFPWVVLEAMAAELPIVATSVGAVPEIIRTGENGLLVNAGDVSELSRAIEKILANTELARKLGAQARATLEERFTLRDMLKPTVELLER